MTATGEILPRTSKMAAQFVASKTAPLIGSKIGRVVGGVAPIITGAVEGGPVGALVGVSAASKGAWAGGKTGWFTTKLLQNAAKPVAATMEAAAPYAQILSTLGGAAGVGDLAQMAEPNRRDIGFLGLGSTAQIQQDKLDGIYATAIENGIKNFGYSTSKAAAVIAKGDPQVFGAAMAAYMKSRMVK